MISRKQELNKAIDGFSLFGDDFMSVFCIKEKTVDFAEGKIRIVIKAK